MTFSEQIVYAMFRPGKYKELIELNKNRHVWFVVVMMLVLSIVTFGVPTGALITSFGGFEKLFTERLGELSYTNDELQLEKPFIMSVDYYNVVIDTSVETITDDMITKDGIVLAVGSKNVRLVYSLGGTIADYQKVALNTVLAEGFNNDTLVKLIPAIYAYLIMAFLINCVYFFAKYAIIALVFTIMINSVNKRLEMHLSYGQVFMICFYGQTLGYILSNFNAALGLLPAAIVSLIGIFISIHMITASIMSMNPRDQV